MSRYLNKLMLALAALSVFGAACQDTSPVKDIADTPTAEAATEEVVEDSFGDAVNAAVEAAEVTQTAQTPEEWSQVMDLWDKSIELMKAVPEASENYQTAQQKAVEYQENLEYAKQNAGLSPVTYTIVDSGGNTVQGRKRIEVRIVAPEAQTFEQRGETVILAAKELQERENAAVVFIILEPSAALAGLGSPLALARYAPDGGGWSGDQDWTWEVEASRDSIDPMQVKVAEKWEEKKDSFQISDGFGGTMTDEDALTEALVKELGITEDQVRFPYFPLESYPVQQ